MTTKMNVSRKVFSEVEVMDWLKSTKGFKDNTLPQDWVDDMDCSKYGEWCISKIKESSMKWEDYLVPYIDFKRLLIDEYYEAKEKDQLIFCIGYNEDNTLKCIQNPTDEDKIAYVCTMPYYKQVCRDCGDDDCADGWWNKEGEFVCADCWVEEEEV
jgi:hypothetical protein